MTDGEPGGPDYTDQDKEASGAIRIEELVTVFAFSDKPQSMGRVLDDSVALYRTSFTRVFPLSLVGAMLMVLPTVLLQHLNGGLQGGMAGVENMSILMWFGLTWIVMVFGYHFLMAGMLLRMARSAANHNYAKSRSTLKTIFGVGSVLTLCTLLYFVCVIMGSMLVIPGIIVMCSMALYAAVAVLGDENPLKSLGNSHTLVWGSWWRTFTILSVGYTIYMIFSMLPYAVMGIFAGIKTLGLLENPPVTLQLVSSLIMALILPLILATTVTCMHDLRLRRFGTDLEARLVG